MFENQVNNQSNTPQANIPSASVTPDTKMPLNGQKPSGASQPDDIFSASDPIPNTLGNRRGELSQEANMPGAFSQESGNAPSVKTGQEFSSEPVIRSTPSVFTPNGSVAQSQVFRQSNPTIPMAPKGGKNLVFLIVIILLACIAVASIAWWFVSRSKERVVENPVMTNLYDSLASNTNKEVTDEGTGEDISNKLLPNEDADRQLQETVKDSDGDGLSDEDEIVYGTSLDSADTDGDGLFDREEIQIYKTDPIRVDTDNDGVGDKQEVLSKTNPLVEDNNSLFYENENLKFSFELLENMIFESSSDNTIRFNNNIDQIKLYIFVDVSNVELVPSDVEYSISQNLQGELIIEDSKKKLDETPVATVFDTNYFLADNGHRYFIRYIATKRGFDLQANFEKVLGSFKFLQ
ncbi:hypothetical protein COV56_03285 [Candidatus Kuenenbacteria bacterium CG11_big_fil_rev_8_21_14_0_20_37_9]|uniref:Uncharacterized protein n=1 Tax=Candidatus Kuenenbacteria bacterium CG08_land_8_20_14_0_20_37_23 TaxID=1974617 RepID=A0A2M6XTK9_9BACT|nr:MAG: hypothetical protein COV56_03285 [Candidatus Kuenenbacteria bacterium CG11_big_fil_rev_8_21_14_0_20_37_9]PIU10993.1 MAG: hypothetical protein COT27_00190 [Candidatus Kuenenbacteria bacterium CG08_land_8_20_14_0_20_37_23]